MFKKFNMLRAACGTGAISLLSMLPLSYAQAVDCKLCEDLSVQEVLEYSAELDSDAVRHQFRGWLAEHYPNTAEGIAAKAWIVGRNGASQAEVEKLYRQALAKDGSISLALVNMAVALNNQEKYEQAIEILALIIDEDWTAKWNTFFYLRSAGEGELAMQKLDEWKQDSNNHLWVPYFLEAWLARQDGDYQEANRLYLEGMYAATEQEQSLNAFTLARWLKNSRDLDNRQGRSTASRQKTFQRAFEFATYSVTPMAFEEAARYAEDQLNNNNAAARARIEGIKFLALPELVSGVVFDLGNTNMPLAMQALEEGKKDFPFNYDVAITEHETYTRFNFDTGIASAALARAMENTTSNFTLKEVASYALGRATRLQDFSGSKALMAEVLPKLDDDNKRSLLGTYLTNRIAAKDFAEAELILDQLASLNTSKTYLNKRQDLLTHFSALVNERNDWLNDQPFLKDWEQRFGDSLRASIEFNTGSSQLLARSNSTIKNAASALNAPGGEAYVFKIEGHTDSTGSDKVNIPLSKARADAVKAALVAQFGVDAARIQTAGYGDNHPIAPNLFSEGRKQNRRVEIRPLGNISDPQIATPGAYDTDYMEISRDGRYAVMGHSPTQIWDLKRQVVVHEIKAGLHHRFSPNGRYLASLSSFTRRGGDTQHVAYIYDVRSGKLVDYLWGTESFQYFDWSPFSDKLLTSTISGDLRVYDVATRKVSQMARPYTSRNAAVVMWSNNGQEIVLKSARQGDRITVLDAETLEPKTNIDERTWAHSFGQSTDGKYAMISQDGNGFVIFDTTQNWKPIHKGSLPLTGGRIYSHPTKPWVMLQAKFETKVQLLLLDISTGKTLASTRLKTNGGGFNIDGSRFITGVDNDLVELDTLTLQKTATSSSRSALAKGLAQIEEKQLIVSSDLNGSSVWSLKTGRRVHTFDTVPSSNWQNLKSTPNKLITVEDENKLVVFDGETFLTTTVWSTKESIQSFATSGDLVVLATVPAGSKNKQINSPYVTLHTLDAHTFKPIKSIKTPLVNGSLRNAPYSFDATITLNGEVVALHTSYSDGFGRRIIDERLVKIFNVLTGEEIGRVSRNYAIENFQLIDNNQALKVRGSGGYQIIDIATNKHTKNEPFNPSYQLTLKDGQTVDWFWDRVSTGKGKALTFPFSLHRLVGSSDNNLLVGQTKTGKIHFIDLKQLETVLTITPFSNGEWLAYTPEGNYTASLHGTEGVY
ncbi:MAG: OmpA family protein, partial [Pontibacterium sp.]